MRPEMKAWCVGASLAAGAACAAAAPSPLTQEFASRAQVILDEAARTGDAVTASQRLSAFMDQAVAYTPGHDLDGLTAATRALLIAEYARESGPIARDVLAALVAHPQAATHLVFAWDRERDDEAVGGMLLLRLVREHADDVARYPALAAAMVLVHDVPGGLTRAINENTTRAANALDVFGYFADNARAMAYSPNATPVELLMHVVDVTSTVADLEWAQSRYGNRPDPEARYFEIDYDLDHFQRGRPKRLTESGRFDIRAIEELGGVCADQAYFAGEVGKACGIPTAYVVAAGTEVGHAWVGFLEPRGRRAAWNLDAGRYDAYQNQRGVILNAGSRAATTDAELRFDAGLYGVPETDRWAANAAGVAVRAALRRPASAEPTRPEARGALETPRTPGDVAQMLDLLRAGLTRAPTTRSAWTVVGELGAQGRLSGDQLEQWGAALDRLCGRDYPDFSVRVLGMMIGGVESRDEQLRLWDWVHGRFGSRPDMSSWIRLHQANLAIEAGDRDKAWWALNDVTNRLIAQAPEAVTVLALARDMLLEQGKVGDAQAMLARAWQRIPKPAQMSGEFRAQSNWYRVGMMYHDALRETNPARAQQVLEDLRK